MKKYVTLFKISGNKHLYHIGIPLITEIILYSIHFSYLQKSLLLSSSDIIFDFKIGVIDMRNEWNKVLFL
jgi:hypothetical protein